MRMEMRYWRAGVPGSWIVSRKLFYKMLIVKYLTKKVVAIKFLAKNTRQSLVEFLNTMMVDVSEDLAYYANYGGIGGMPKVEIPAVRDRDLRSILEQQGLTTKLDNGQLFCSSCGTTIEWSNLEAIVVTKLGLELHCDDPTCVEEAFERTNK